MKSPAVEPTAALLAQVEGHPVFASLPESALRQLLAQTTEVSAATGTTIVHRGAPGDAMFVILEGEAEVPICDGDGRHRFTAHLVAGDVFGEMSLLTGEPRTADVVAATDVRCLRLERAMVDRLVQREPKIAGLLTSLLGHRLLQSDGIRTVGKYELIGELGVGGMGRVFRGMHPQLGRPVAVKMLDHELVHHEDFAERFRAEARIIASMRHPNIVDLYDVEEAYGTMFIILQQLDGESLDVTLERGPLDAATVRRIVRDVASALHCAHSHGVVHRDVKPSNVLLLPGPRACLTDFGVAARSNGVCRDDGRFLGTPTYASPEHALGQEVDARSDIYALGVMAWELLVGRPPFTGTSTREILRRHIHEDVPPILEANPAVPTDLAAVIDRATQRDPDARWESGQAILDYLDLAERRSSAPRSVKVRTVTLVYTPDADGDVDRLLTTFERMAAPIDGLRVKLSE